MTRGASAEKIAKEIRRETRCRLSVFNLPLSRKRVRGRLTLRSVHSRSADRTERGAHWPPSLENLPHLRLAAVSKT